VTCIAKELAMSEFSPSEKMSILRQYLLAGNPITDVCDQHGITEETLAAWQKHLFTVGHVAFNRKYLTDREALMKKLDTLPEQIAQKKVVISHLKELQVLYAEEPVASEPQERCHD